MEPSGLEDPTFCGSVTKGPEFTKPTARPMGCWGSGETCSAPTANRFEGRSPDAFKQAPKYKFLGFVSSDNFGLIPNISSLLFWFLNTVQVKNEKEKQNEEQTKKPAGWMF